MEDLKQFVLEKSQYFNMKVICEKAGVNYSTFRGWKNNGNTLSEEKLKLYCMKFIRTLPNGMKTGSHGLNNIQEIMQIP